MGAACRIFGSANSSIGKAAVALVLVCFSASAQSNPYMVIAARNAFGLKPPPIPQPQQPEPPKRPAPILVLTGIVDFSRKQWALITRTDPGSPPKNYTLHPGETEGGLQLIDIDARSATATVRVDGIDIVPLRLGSSENQNSKPPTVAVVNRAVPRPR